jgi:hypothetical protein
MDRFLSVKPIEQLAEFLLPYPNHLRELAESGRQFLTARFPTANEIFWDATQGVGIGLTYTHSTSDNFLNLVVYAKHLNLNFPYGAMHQDPKQLLQGKGSRVRHLRWTAESPMKPDILALIDQAEAIAKRPSEPLPFIQIVKIMEGPKRNRPNQTF